MWNVAYNLIYSRIAGLLNYCFTIYTLVIFRKPLNSASRTVRKIITVVFFKSAQKARLIDNLVNKANVV